MYVILYFLETSNPDRFSDAFLLSALLILLSRIFPHAEAA